MFTCICFMFFLIFFFFFQAEDGIRDLTVTGVQTCALPILWGPLWKRDGVRGFDLSVRHRQFVTPLPPPSPQMGREGPAAHAGRSAPLSLKPTLARFVAAAQRTLDRITPAAPFAFAPGGIHGGVEAPLALPHRRKAPQIGT